MRPLLTAFLLLFSGLCAHAKGDPNHLYAITFSGGFATTRYAKAEYAETLRPGRPDCVVVTWGYAPQNEDNDAELKPERERADTAVSAELDAHPEAVVAAITLRGLNSRWIIYTPAGPEFAASIEDRLRLLTKSKFKVQFARDTEWKVLANYVKSLQQTK